MPRRMNPRHEVSDPRADYAPARAYRGRGRTGDTDAKAYASDTVDPDPAEDEPAEDKPAEDKPALRPGPKPPLWPGRPSQPDRPTATDRPTAADRPTATDRPPGDDPDNPSRPRTRRPKR